MPNIYAFQDSRMAGNTTANYLTVVGGETAWPGARGLPTAEVTDALAETILVVENRGANVHWMEPRDLTLADIDVRLNSPAGVSSPHDTPAIATANGAVHRLTARLRPEVLRALLTARGGERLVDGEGGWELLADGRLRPRVAE
jgi:hypothetical protein